MFLLFSTLGLQLVEIKLTVWINDSLKPLKKLAKNGEGMLKNNHWDTIKISDC